MKNQVVAMLIAEGTRALGTWFRGRPVNIERAPTHFNLESTLISPHLLEGPIDDPDPEIPIPAPSIKTPSKTPLSTKATQIATGCIPCAIGHIGTCSGVINEAMRFAKKDGLQGEEVLDRVGMCLDELNAMERIDLRPEMTVDLVDWERELADQVLVLSRNTRHLLEGLSTVEDLERAAADTQSARADIWRQWMRKRMEHLTPEESTHIQQNAISKITDLLKKDDIKDTSIFDEGVDDD